MGSIHLLANLYHCTRRVIPRAMRAPIFSMYFFLLSSLVSPSLFSSFPLSLFSSLSSVPVSRLPSSSSISPSLTHFYPLIFSALTLLPSSSVQNCISPSTAVRKSSEYWGNPFHSPKAPSSSRNHGSYHKYPGFPSLHRCAT